MNNLRPLNIRIPKDLDDMLIAQTVDNPRKKSHAARIALRSGLETANLEHLKERVRSSNELASEFRHLRLDLGLVGGNLNQLMTRLNMSGDYLPRDHSGVIKVQQELVNSFAVVMSKLKAIENGL